MSTVPSRALRPKFNERPRRMHPYLATSLAVCGGLSVLFAFFAAVGAVDPVKSSDLTIAAVGLALVWLFGFVHRVFSAPALSQRHDRERRGF